MVAIPPVLLRRLYVAGSLRNQGEGFVFQLRNQVAQGTMVGLLRVTVDGEERSLDGALVTVDGTVRPAAELSHAVPLVFRVGTVATFFFSGPLTAGEHSVEVTVDTREIGPVPFPVTDTVE